MSFFFDGKLYFIHHFVIALSETPNSSPIFIKVRFLILFFKSSLEILISLFLTLFLCSQSLHLVDLVLISFPQSTQYLCWFLIGLLYTILFLFLPFVVGNCILQFGQTHRRFSSLSSRLLPFI